VPVVQRKNNGSTKEKIVFMSSEIQESEKDQDWDPEGEEEEEEQIESEYEEDAESNNPYSGDDSCDEEEIPEPTKPLKNLVLKNIKQQQANPIQVVPIKATCQNPASITLQPKKRKAPIQKTPKAGPSKRSKPSTSNENQNKHEISGENLELTKDEKKKIETLFDDSNVDYNLYCEAPENIVEKKVMLSNNLMIVSKMMEATGDKGQTYEYPAISFQRKLKSQKAYTFNLPLNMIPTLIKGLQMIMNDNQTYFSKPKL
jgi:hypothetical protein